MAYTRPAAFVASDLSVTPTEVEIGETVNISVLMTNTGDLVGSYEVTFKIDGVEVSTMSVTLGGGNSKRIIYTTSKDVVKSYPVNVNGLLGTIVVKEVPPTPPAPPTTPAPPETPVEPTDTTPDVTPEPFNWWLVGGFITGAIIVGVVVWWIVRRRWAL